MITLYSVPVSLYCAKLRIVLRHKSLLWNELPPPGGYGSEEYRALVPAGNLPALRDDDLLLSDSEAIAEYLNEAYPTPRMLPTGIPDRAKARERSRFHDTRFEPQLRLAFKQIAVETRDPNKLNQIGSELSRHLQTLARLLRDAPLKDSLLFADCGFAISFEWVTALEQAIGLDIKWPHDVKTYKTDLRRHRAVDEELSHYASAINTYIEGFKHAA